MGRRSRNGPDRRLLNVTADINGPGHPRVDKHEAESKTHQVRGCKILKYLWPSRRRAFRRSTKRSSHAKPYYYSHVTVHHPLLRLPRPSTPSTTYLPHTRCHQSHRNSTRKLQTSLNPSSVVGKTSILSSSLDWGNVLVRFRHSNSTPRNCGMTSKYWRSKSM